MASILRPLCPSSCPSPSCPRRLPFASTPLHRCAGPGSLRLIPRAQDRSGAGSTSGSNASEVGVVAEEPRRLGVSSLEAKKLSPLENGGTITGRQAEGKDPGPAALDDSRHRYAPVGKFSDARWKNGTWDLQQFSENGKVNWDAVIDAEVLRRRWLEENPEASNNEEPVVFETSTIPWWPWVKRFHLPEAELLNGRAAMVGFFMAYLVDSLTGVGLVDQMNNYVCKLLLFIAVVAILLIRKNEDVANLRQSVKEWNFYDKQWQATWEDSPRSDKLE